jgi:hypothetical protein
MLFKPFLLTPIPPARQKTLPKTGIPKKEFYLYTQHRAVYRVHKQVVIVNQVGAKGGPKNGGHNIKSLQEKVEKNGVGGEVTHPKNSAVWGGG